MADLFPLARTDDLLAGFYVPGDGRVNPVDLTMSLAKRRPQLGRQHHRRGARSSRCHANNRSLVRRSPG
jgi:glycine/D-amino acid oxidase-like deaminating enzyme